MTALPAVFTTIALRSIAAREPWQPMPRAVIAPDMAQIEVAAGRAETRIVSYGKADALQVRAK